MKIIGYGSKLSVEKVYSKKKKKSVEKEKKIKNLNKTDDASLISRLNYLRCYRSKSCRVCPEKINIKSEETDGGRPRILRWQS